MVLMVLLAVVVVVAMATLETTFNSITQDYWPTTRIARIVGHGHPILTALLAKARPGGGRKCDFDVEYDFHQGGWRTLTGAMTNTEKEIITQGSLDWVDSYIGVKIQQSNIFLNRHDPRKIANYFDAQVNNAVVSMRQRNLAPAVFTNHADLTNSWYSLTDAINDTTPYAGIANTGGAGIGIPSWRALIGEADYGAVDSIGVSPSRENFSKILRLQEMYFGERADMIVTSGAVFDCLMAQALNAAPETLTVARGIGGVNVGRTRLWIDDVPVIADPWFATAQCTDFSGTGHITRATVGGHGAMFINWDYIDLITVPEWWLRWDDAGWIKPSTATYIENQIHAACCLTCRSRCHQARLFGIDPTQTPASYTLIGDDQINLASFVIPPAT